MPTLNLPSTLNSIIIRMQQMTIEEGYLTFFGNITHLMRIMFRKSVILAAFIPNYVDSTKFRWIVGSLRYICNNRPYIYYLISVISKFMNDPRKPHLVATERILRYIKGTVEYGLLFPNGSKSEVNEFIGYSYGD